MGYWSKEPCLPEDVLWIDVYEDVEDVLWIDVYKCFKIEEEIPNNRKSKRSIE